MVSEQVRASEEAAETAIAFVDAHLTPTIDFMAAGSSREKRAAMAVACAFAQYIATLIETMLMQVVERLSVNENVSMSQFDLVD